MSNEFLEKKKSFFEQKEHSRLCFWRDIPEDEPKKGLLWNEKAVVQHPFLLILVAVGLSLGCLVWLFVNDEIALADATDNTTFDVKGDIRTERYNAVTQAIKVVEKDRYDGIVFGERSIPGLYIIMMIYEATGDNVFTKEIIENGRKFEEQVLLDPDYQDHCWLMGGNCVPSQSFWRMFYTQLDGSGNPIYGTDNATMVDDPLAALAYYKSIGDPTGGAYFGADYTNGTGDVYAAKITRSFIMLGSPLDGFNNSLDRPEEQYALNSKFQTKFYESFKDASNDSVNLLFMGDGFIFEILTDLLVHDAMLALFSIGFLVFYIVFHTQSLYLTLVGLSNILMAMPIAQTLFVNIFDVHKIQQLNMLGIYVILAIGADNVFVYTDAWKQSILYDDYIGIRLSSNVFQRFRFVWRRAARAMLNTSLTTTAAFTATALSPLFAISSFGYFAGFLVITNYILIITYYPAHVIIWNRLGEKFMIWFPFRALGKLKMDSRTEASELAAAERGRKEKKYRMLENFFRTHHYNFLKKYGKIIIVVILLFVAYAFSSAVQIQPVQEQENFLPEDHPFQRFISLISTGFVSTDEDPHLKDTITFGLKGFKRAGGRILEIGTEGEVVYDENFDPSTLAAQAYFKTACQMIRDSDLTRSDEADCIYDDLEIWGAESTPSFSYPFPTGAGYVGMMKMFLSNTTYLQRYGSMVGLAFDGDAVKFLSIVANTTIFIGDEASQVREKQLPIYKAWEELMDTINENSPTELGDAFQILYPNMDMGGGSSWKFMHTQGVLISSAVYGALASLVLAFLVLWFSSANIIIAAMAIGTICCILITVVGIMHWMGWSIGVPESINATILVGLSVDYVVHLCNSYTESHQYTREDRSKDMLTEMAITVLSGAMTSIGASLALFFCWLSFLNKFGAFMVFTIGTSIVYALVLFSSAMLLFGPQGRVGTYKWLAKKLHLRKSHHMDVSSTELADIGQVGVVTEGIKTREVEDEENGSGDERSDSDIEEDVKKAASEGSDIDSDEAMSDKGDEEKEDKEEEEEREKEEDEDEKKEEGEGDKPVGGDEGEKSAEKSD